MRLRRSVQVPARARTIRRPPIDERRSRRGRRHRRRRRRIPPPAEPARGRHAVRPQAPRAEQEQGGRLPPMARGYLRVRHPVLGRGHPGRRRRQRRAGVRVEEPQRDPGHGRGPAADAPRPIRATVQVRHLPQEPVPSRVQASAAADIVAVGADASADVSAQRRVRPVGDEGDEAGGDDGIVRARARHAVVAAWPRGDGVGTHRGYPRGYPRAREPGRGVPGTGSARATQDDVHASAALE